MFLSRPTAVLVLVLAALAGLAASAGAQPQPQSQLQPQVPAGDAAEVERLLQRGRTDEALARVDRSLADRPADAQLRFLRGVILGEMQRGDEAAAVFERLTQDYPELPEPYNNLAVLHAAAGRYEQARAALEQAIRLDPGYAVAHENLGDVQARLAAASYERAQRLDPRHRPSATAKLAALRRLFPSSPAPAASAPAAR